ncbi:hypothetical protein [Paenibacillus taichungensis]|nr:hypothetical protein [Paenibacillus taichungensis]
MRAENAKPFMDLKGEDYRTMLTLTEQESLGTMSTLRYGVLIR